jgi:hypothetical protein
MDSGPPPPPPLRSAFNGGGGGSGMSIKECAQICGQETSMQINGSQWISDPPWCSAFNRRGGGVRNGYSFRRAPGHMWHQPIGPQVPSPTCYLTARHSWTSSSTESTCSTCSRGRVTSHNCCQSLLSVLHPFHS